MQLPEPIFSAVSQAFDAQHALWHLIRFRREALPPALHADWDQGRVLFPGVKFLDEAGSGAEFLVFHREMVRIFKGILGANPGSGVAYEPWREIPADVAGVLANAAGLDLDAAKAEIDRLVRAGTRDELGAFIEATDLAQGRDGADVHNTTHGAIGFLENSQGTEFHMGNPRTAPRNALFWRLHGWIDEFYAAWQRNHGETVDQSPLPPGHHHAPMHRMMAARPARALRQPAAGRAFATLFRRRFNLDKIAAAARKAPPAAKSAGAKPKGKRKKPARAMRRKTPPRKRR